MGSPDCFGPSAAIGAALFSTQLVGLLVPGNQAHRSLLALNPVCDRVAHIYASHGGAIHSPETIGRVGDAIRRRYRDNLHLPRMGRATLMTGPQIAAGVCEAHVGGGRGGRIASRAFVGRQALCA
eukprot:6173569-Pleurochrysis_carterae.AAC.1